MPRARHQDRGDLQRGGPGRAARALRRRGRLRRAVPLGRVLPQHLGYRLGGRDHRGRRDSSRIRVPVRERLLRRDPPRLQHRVHRTLSRGDPQDGRQVRRPPHGRRGRRADGAGLSGSARERGRGAPVGAQGGLSGDPQGLGGWRRPRHARRARRTRARVRLRHGAGGGREGLRQRRGLHGEVPREPAPHRVPGLRRLPRQPAPPGRARVLDPAAPPEADRGGAVRGARRGASPEDGRGGGRGRPRRALHQRGNGRVPARLRRRVLLHGDEHASPGRAPHHRGGDGARPRQGADRGGRGRGRCPSRTTTRRRAGTRSSSGSTPRTR